MIEKTAGETTHDSIMNDADYRWHIEEVKISDLKGLKSNPRKLSRLQAAHLEHSIRKFGYIDEIIINTDNTIIAGHQRIRILKGLGYKKIQVKVPNVPLSEKDAQELCIRHNRNSGEWDFDVLANEWDLGNLLEWGFEPKDFDIGKEEQEKQEEIKVDCSFCQGDEIELNGHKIIVQEDLHKEVSKMLNAAIKVLQKKNIDIELKLNGKEWEK